MNVEGADGQYLMGKEKKGFEGMVEVGQSIPSCASDCRSLWGNLT